MDLSVVVPTLNGRAQLATTLDALTERVPDGEVIVVNGPSTDGTTGMVRDRSDVDALVEVADRPVAPARNAGIDHATGEVIALVDQGLVVSESWAGAVERGIDAGDVVTGPVHEQLRGGLAADYVESDTVAGREVTFFAGGNAAFRRETLDAVDGFDEYLTVGSARDCAHRLAALDASVTWLADASVERGVGADGGTADETGAPGRPGTTPVGADGGSHECDRPWKYRGLAYRLVKNYGVRPAVARRLFGLAGRDALGSLRDVVRGDATPSGWLSTGRDVSAGIATGSKDGLWARTLDRTPRRNPYGRSHRSDRAVAVYDWR
jgi:glycosyltransferase involved in cell wall biosynthesis